jgi:hypothetical protein
MTASFTMNWKVMTPGVSVLFEAGEPLFQAIPLAGDVCGDLEGATIRQGKLADDPELSELYRQWSAARQDFHRLTRQEADRGGNEAALNALRLAAGGIPARQERLLRRSAQLHFAALRHQRMVNGSLENLRW